MSFRSQLGWYKRMLESQPGSKISGLFKHSKHAPCFNMARPLNAKSIEWEIRLASEFYFLFGCSLRHSRQSRWYRKATFSTETKLKILILIRGDAENSDFQLSKCWKVWFSFKIMLKITIFTRDDTEKYPLEVSVLLGTHRYPHLIRCCLRR